MLYSVVVREEACVRFVAITATTAEEAQRRALMLLPAGCIAISATPHADGACLHSVQLPKLRADIPPRAKADPFVR